GLDRPLPQQFMRFVNGVVRWDFGRSLRTKRSVRSEIADRFMPTFWLTVWSMGWSVLFGMTIGILSAVWRNRWPDRLGMTLAVSGISFPAFALGMVLMQVFPVELGWLLIDAVDMRDYPVIQALVLLFSLEFILINLVVDVLYGFINPTIRYR